MLRAIAGWLLFQLFRLSCSTERGDADALSRRPHESIENEITQRDDELLHQFAEQHLPGDDEKISPEVVEAICQSGLLRAQAETSLVESLSISAESVPEVFTDDPHGLPVVPALSQRELQEKQRADPSIREVIHQLESGEKVPPTARDELPEIPLLLRELNKLEIVNGILYRKRHDNEQPSYQLVLPEELRSTVLQSLHDHMGHMGIERTLDLARTRFYWPRMTADVERKVKTCGRCVRHKTLPEKAAPLVSTRTSRPLELLCMDFLSIEPDTSNTKDVLVITDHFTKFAVAIPTANQKAKTVARCLMDNFIVYYGIPERLHTDQGPDFESKLIRELCDVAGIRKCRTTPYHPRGNPVERFNRTLLNMLGTLETKQKSKWREFVKPLVHAYNCTRNEVTGFTPYELMFGRSPRLPVDLAFQLPVHETKHQPHTQYVQDLKSRLEESYRIASKNSARSNDRNKVRFDKQVRPSQLAVGDRVLVKNVRIRGKHKLSDRWEQDIFIVVKRAGDLPVYTVRPEGKDGPTRTVHRDLLLPCGFLPEGDVGAVSETSLIAEPRKTRQQKQARLPSRDSAEEDEVPEEMSVPLVPETVRFSVEKFQIPAPPTLLSADEVSSSDSEEIPVEVHSPEFSTSPVENTVAGNGDLPGNELDPTQMNLPVHLCEDLPEHLPDPNHPVVTNVPVENGSEEMNILETDLAEPLNFESINLPDNEIVNTQPAEFSLRRSNRHRSPPRRLEYVSLGNPLISVVQTLLHSLYEALGTSTATA